MARRLKSKTLTKRNRKSNRKSNRRKYKPKTRKYTKKIFGGEGESQSQSTPQLVRIEGNNPGGHKTTVNKHPKFDVNTLNHVLSDTDTLINTIGDFSNKESLTHENVKRNKPLSRFSESQLNDYYDAVKQYKKNKDKKFINNTDKSFQNVKNYFDKLTVFVAGGNNAPTDGIPVFERY